MDIFSSFDQGTARLNQKISKAIVKNKGKSKRSRANFSDNEIREKVKAHLSKNAKTKGKVLQDVEKKVVEKKSEESVAAGPGVLVNDPNNGVTTEKLKGVLTSGSFSFSGKERDILEKILKNK